MGSPGTRYSKEFKAEAVNQVIDRGYSVKDVAERIGVSQHSLYLWVKRARAAASDSDQSGSPRELAAEVARLKSELRRTQEERDILRKPGRSLWLLPGQATGAAAYFANSPSLRDRSSNLRFCGTTRWYAFVKDHRTEFRVATMCRVLGIHRSGFYAWLKQPMSTREREDEHLLEHIRHFWNESDGTYGSPRVFLDLRAVGERCGRYRVARLMRANGISAAPKRRRPKGTYAKPEHARANLLNREFNRDELDTAWVTDITYIRTWQGWLYLAAVMDLASRRIVGWSMQRTMHRDLVVQALLSAVWRRRPQQECLSTPTRDHNTSAMTERGSVATITLSTA
jgi:transposase-like protein